MASPEALYGAGTSILITGASSGIGAVLAEHLAQYGGRLALVARRADRLEEVAAKVRAAGGEPLVIVADVSDASAVARAHAEIAERQGAVQVAFLNAGIGATMPIHRFKAEIPVRAMQVNYFGAVYWIEHLLPPMLERSAGVIVGISSLAALASMPANGGYSASKAALSNLLSSLRMEAAPRGLQISTVEPGFVRSELTDQNKTPMPFLMETLDAVRIICDEVADGRAVIRFPWPMSAALRVLQTIPRPLYERIGAAMAGKMTRKKSSPTPKH
ncbi:MAG: SDR family NAD(P)-dependent oxidoreductase [Deltaproteobacteria bacterium]|nr:SDR family NAD(P)-dependent oxidoreductase [Deltaproteobacteria bacterium]